MAKKKKKVIKKTVPVPDYIEKKLEKSKGDFEKLSPKKSKN